MHKIVAINCGDIFSCSVHIPNRDYTFFLFLLAVIEARSYCRIFERSVPHLNRDGLVQPSELAEVFKRRGASSAQARVIFDHADTDRNGELDEFECVTDR